MVRGLLFAWPFHDQCSAWELAIGKHWLLAAKGWRVAA